MCFFSFPAVSLRFSGGVAAAQLRVCKVFALKVAEAAAETANAGDQLLRGEDGGDKWTLQPECGAASWPPPSLRLLRVTD